MKTKKLLGISLSCILAFASLTVPAGAEELFHQTAILANEGKTSSITLSDGTMITYDNTKFEINTKGVLTKYPGFCLFHRLLGIFGLFFLNRH